MAPHDYSSSLLLVMVPGCQPVWRNFRWRFAQGAANDEAAVQLWLKDPLPYSTSQGMLERGQLFAQYFAKPTRLHEKGVLEIRRGGGLQFEFGVVVGMLAVLELAQREQRK